MVLINFDSYNERFRTLLCGPIPLRDFPTGASAAEVIQSAEKEENFFLSFNYW